MAFMNRIVTMLLCIGSVMQVCGQNPRVATISGKVSNKAGNTLAFASVVVDSLNFGAACNEQGIYQIENLPPGTYTVTASLTGYQKQTHKVSVSAGKTTVQNFVLIPDIEMLKGVTVESPKNEAKKIIETGFNVQVIETKQFENRAMNIHQVLKQAAGVRIRETGGLGSDFEFSLNGLSGNQVRFFLDGVPLENYGANFNLNTIPANIVERVEVYKGAVPVHLGADALGGAVNIVTKQKFNNYLDASYSYGSFNTHLGNLSGQWRKSAGGFTLRPKAYVNKSDNNYTMFNQQTIDAAGNRYVGDFERFHDKYSQYLLGVEVGFTKVKWADELMFSVSGSNMRKDIQTGFTGGRNSDGSFKIAPFGAAFSEEENYNYALKYRNAQLLKNKLQVQIHLSGNFTRQKNIDSSSQRYNWEGDVISTTPTGSEVDANKYTIHFTQKYVVLNTGASYVFNPHHKISANFVYDFLWRQGRNTYYPTSSSRADPFREPNHLSKSVIGLAYQNTTWKDKLQTILSVKMYDINILAREAKEYNWGVFTTEDVRTKKRQFGYGLASRLKINNLVAKVSYEYALRQPERIEIFGDGFLVLSNPHIKPETSHNMNAGIGYSWKLGENDVIHIGADGFLRDVKDLIRIAPNDGGRFSQYVNLFRIFIAGVEGEVRYNHRFKEGQIFTVVGNITYQSVINNEKYVRGTSIPNFVYRDQLYNTPFLFGNWDVNYTCNLGKTLRLNAFYSGNYVQSFYLNYPSIATAGKKNTIPTQLINNIGATLSIANGRYNVTAECNNLANAMAYDNFAIQKPGRTMLLKLRYFLQ